MIKARLYLFDKSLSCAMRKGKYELFNALFSKFPKMAELLYNARLNEYEESLGSLPDISEDDSRILWNKLCDRIEKETGNKLQKI